MSSSVQRVLTQRHNRWLALVLLQLGEAMSIVDGTIVNVALASIKIDLGLSETSFVWVINAYVLTFAGFTLLSGRLGDIFGHRRMFLIGIAIFTLASSGCGLVSSKALFVGCRAVQGLGGAIVCSAVMSLEINLFREPAERAKVLGIFGVVSAGAGVVGLLLGGALTSALGWHWIFLINLPIGVVVYGFALTILPVDDDLPGTADRSVDFLGAITVTLALLLATYAILSGDTGNWPLLGTPGLLFLTTTLLIIFLRLEALARVPLVPLSFFRRRNSTIAVAALALHYPAMGASYYITGQYLLLVLKLSPMTVAFTFLPASVLYAGLSLTISKLILHLGTKRSLVLGLALEVTALLLFSRAPVGGSLMWDVLPATLLATLGGTVAFNSLLLAAMRGVEHNESGLASGLINTTSTMAGTLGIALLARVAGARTQELLIAGSSPRSALNGGYHVAFALGAAFAAAAAVCGSFLWLADSKRGTGTDEAQSDQKV